MKTSILAICTVAILSGCTTKADDPPMEQNVGMANPASVYCLEKGGKIEQQQDKDGVSGICVLPNGEKIEQWALYYRDHK